MGIYFNPNNKAFTDSVHSKIYVDKTGLIAHTNECLDTRDKFICVSRPRRFGKSMALEMLAAYYSMGCDSRELFSGFHIAENAGFEKYLNKFHVIYLNMQQFLSEAGRRNMIPYLESMVMEELAEVYGDIVKDTDAGLSRGLRRIYAKTDKTFIFLIDEWDCVMREKQAADDLQREYLDFLRNLLKDQPYVTLAYMTGILPVKKYGTHSALNMFSEYSMTDPDVFEEYTGFTEAEVKGLCRQYGMDFAEISRWYDGYTFTEYRHVYNPRSVVEALRRGKLANYWTKTETYEALKVYIEMDFEGLKGDIIQMLAGGRVQVNVDSFQNDMKTFHTKDDVLTLLVHLGYLGYESGKCEVFIPNREIRGEYENAMSVGGWPQVMKVLKASEQLLEDTLRGCGEEVAAALDRAHMEAASVLTYNDENSMACAVSLAYYSARKSYQMVRELPGGKGFADIVFLPLKPGVQPAVVVELKYNKSARTAIEQIKERNYTQALENYSGEIVLVGISYDKETKKHSCIIERQSRTA